MEQKDKNFELLNRNQKEKCKAEERWEFVKKYEEAGLTEKEIYELIQIVKENTDNDNRKKALEKLKELYLDKGMPEKALKCLNTLTNLFPKEGHYFREIGIIYEENDEYEKAREIYIKGYEQTGDKKFLAYIKDLETNTEVVNPPESDLIENELMPSTVADSYKILDLFAGREGIYAKQWVSKTGDTGYSPIHEALTPAVIQKHLEGNITVGVYQIKLDNTVNFIAFDIDIRKNIYNDIVSKKEEFKKAINECAKVGKDILNLLASQGIEAYPEFSGNKGYHIWIFLDTPIAARIARHFCFEIKKRISIPDNVHLDIFPKQSFVREDKTGNLIKLPFGFHLKTWQQSYFVDGDFKRIKDQKGFLHSIKKTKKSLIVSAIANFETENLYLNKKEANAEEKPDKTNSEEEFTNPFEEKEFIPEQDEELQRVLKGCPVLKTIYQKSINSEKLTGQEITVLVYTLGCLRNGVEIVNYALKRSNSDSKHFLKSRLNGNPTSCEKIRQRVPEIVNSVECSCEFDREKFTYNTPNIYAKFDTLSETPMLDIVGFEKLFENYLTFKKEILKLKKQLKQIETRINKLFDEAGVDTIKLPQGTLKRIKEENGNFKFSVEIE